MTAAPPRTDSRKIIRDPVHGLVEFRDDGERLLFKALSSKSVQRLRLIKQCGFAELVFPSLSHSRFEHALGAYHVMRQYLQRLDELWSDKRPPTDPYDFALRECRTRFTEEAKFHLKVAAFLHDFGHPPFSHATDDFLGGGKPKPHERWAFRLLDEGYPPELPDSVRSEVRVLLQQAYDVTLPGSFEPMRQLLSSPIDVDRVDYLARDCYHGGVSYAQIDLPWLLRTLEVSHRATEDFTAQPVLCYHDRRGLWFLEALLSARRTMYIQVYLHRVVVAATSMYRMMLSRLRGMDWSAGAFGSLVSVQKGSSDVSKYLNLHDAALWAEMYRFADGEGAGSDPVVKRLAEGLVTRNFFFSYEIPSRAPGSPSVVGLRDLSRSRLAPLVAKRWSIDGDAAEALCDIKEESQKILDPKDGGLYIVSVDKTSKAPSEARQFIHDPDVGTALTRFPVTRRWLICPREVAAEGTALIEEIEKSGGVT